MRPALKTLPFLLLASLPATAQDNAPRVLFCSGPCFTVDAKGVRTPAPKGTALAPGQRLETGPNGYAQMRLGRDVAVGVGEQARVRFERSAVVLDEGRLRLVGGVAIGRPESSTIQLRTGDGTLVLHSPDVEVRKSSIPGAATTPTFIKVNAGDAGLRSGQGEIALPRQSVQGIVAGRIMTAASVPPTALAPAARPTLAGAPVTRAPVMAPLSPIRIATPLVREPIVLAPTISPTLSPTIVTQPTLTPVVSIGDTLLREPIVDSSTGTTTTLTKIVNEPITTTTTLDKTLTVQPTRTLSPTLSTDTRLLIRR